MQRSQHRSKIQCRPHRPPGHIRRRRAFEPQRPHHQLVVQGLGHLALLRPGRVNQITKMKIAVAHMTQEKVGNATGIGFGHGLQQAVGQA